MKIDKPSSNPKAKIDLTNTIYQELKKVAAAKMRNEKTPQTLQATALVHEAWLRIGGENQPDWVNRAHFFSSAAEAMRRILVDRARKRQAARHGGGQIRIEMDSEENTDSLGIKAAQADDQILALNDAISELEEGDPETAELVKLHYFVGLKIDEVATMLDVSKRTAERRLAFARAWLARHLQLDD